LSEGTVYLPSANLTMGGASNGKVPRGQLIVNSMPTGGSTRLGLEHQQYADTSIPAIFLIERRRAGAAHRHAARPSPVARTRCAQSSSTVPAILGPDGGRGAYAPW